MVSNEIWKKQVTKGPIQISATSGYLVVIHVPWLRQMRGQANGFWKYGISLEMKEWLDSIAGSRAKNPTEWEEGKGSWIHLGATQAKNQLRIKNAIHLSFRLRNKGIAAMFKLRFHKPE